MSTIFAPWLPLWTAEDPSLAKLTLRVEELLQRRARIRRTVPPIRLKAYREPLAQFYRLLARLEGRDGILPRAEYRLALRILGRLDVLARAAAWPRWLELERGLARLGAMNDLLCGALLIRELIEEVGRMRRIASESRMGSPCEQLRSAARCRHRGLAARAEHPGVL
jgi:hypothetical protein